MNFKQFLKLNEMYVKENGKEYFLIPATIDNIKKCKTINDVLIRNISISEFYGCFCHMLDHYLKTKTGFYIANRPKNSKTLAKLGIDIDKPYAIKMLITRYLRYLSLKDFVETQTKDGYKNDVVYIFKIKYFAKRFKIPQTAEKLKRDMYIKFNFIYSYEVKDGKLLFNLPSIKDNSDSKYIIVEPKSMILWDISFHEDN